MDVLAFALIACSVFCITVTAFILQMEQMRKRHHAEVFELIKLVKSGSLSEYQADQAKLPKDSNYIKEAIRDSYRRGEDED